MGLGVIMTNLAVNSNTLQSFLLRQCVVTYDFESARNVYSYVAYVKETNEIKVYGSSKTPIDRVDIIKRSLAENHETMTQYFESIPTVTYEEITVENFVEMFMNPEAYRVGFNTDYYDLLIVAFILAFITDHGQLPATEAVRNINDLIISARDILSGDPYFVSKSQQLGVYTKEGKLTNTQIFQLTEDVVPSFSKIYYNLKNTGLFVDLKLLNEKDKDDAGSEYTSLKRIAAQLGYRIEEPEGIDLSDSYKELTTGEITTLLVYNVSDVLVSYLVFNHEVYVDVRTTREKLLSRFAERFVKKLNVNSTSAQFITNVIAPKLEDKLVDNPVIETFFPVHGPEHQHVYDTIRPYYEALVHKKFKEFLEMPIVLNMTEEQKKYLVVTRSIEAIQALDKVFTDYLQMTEQYGPLATDPNKNMRYRIKHGELQEDLLEYMHNRYAKFPEEVYLMYSYYRNSPSRKDAIERFIEDYPEPPENFVYKKSKGSAVYDKISCVVVIKDTSMVLSFSIGGVHGEVIDVEPYQRADKIVRKFNATLEYLEQYYEPATLIEAAKNNTLPSDVLTKLDLAHDSELDQMGAITKFVTKGSGKNPPKFKSPKKRISPKDYVRNVDVKNVLHADVDSLYPSLLIILRIFAKFDSESFTWKDIYRELRDERLAMKNFAHRIPEEEWTEEEYKAEAIQLLNKLLLNSASGVLDAGYDTNVRANNNAMSMRICGQLILTDLVFAADELGGESVSTNTDGVYLTGVEIDILTPVVEAWKAKYHLGAKPEIMTRFISKDSNNRFEQKNPESDGKAAGGTIGNNQGETPSKKMGQPSMVDETVVEYFKTHENVVVKPENGYDREWIRQYIEKKLDVIQNATEYTPDIRKKMLSFMWSMQPSKGTCYGLSDGQNIYPTQHVNRFVLTKTGYKLLATKPSDVMNKDGVNNEIKPYRMFAKHIHSKNLQELAQNFGVKYNSFMKDLTVNSIIANLAKNPQKAVELMKECIIENKNLTKGNPFKITVKKLTKANQKALGITEIEQLEKYYENEENIQIRNKMTMIVPLMQQAQLNQFGYDSRLIDPDRPQFMKSMKVPSYDPKWLVTRCNEDMSHYYQDPMWKNIDVDSYIQFVEQTLDIWVNDDYELAKELQSINQLYNFA